MSNYIKEALAPRERIVYTTHQHWILFTESVSVILIGLTILSLSSAYAGEAAPYINYVAYIVLLYGLIKVLLEYIRHTSSKFVITNERVIIKIGVLKRKSLTIQLSKIESVEVNQSLLGQILDFGTIHITGTGTATSQFEYMSHPGMFRRKLQLASELDAHDQDISDSTATRPARTQVRRLRRR